jgi:TolB-like protein/Flp pilus assembly protein TadD
VSDISENISKDLEDRIVKAKSDSFAEASKRLDDEITERAKDVFNIRKTREDQDYKIKLQKTISAREAEENKINTLANKYFDRLQKELRNKIEVRIHREEEERRRIEEEERRQQELIRQQLEEETRREKELLEHQRAEGERVRLEEETRIHKEEQQLRELENQKRLDEENQQRVLIAKQKEEEKRIKDTEKYSRVRTLIASANEYLAAGDSELALVEVAKALVNDPTNAEALELEARIREHRREEATTTPEIVEEKQKHVARERKFTESTKPAVKKRSSIKFIAGILAILTIVTILVWIQMKKYVFTLPVRVAVMPWVNQSNTLEENVLGTALAEEVADKFSSFSGTPVMSFSSTYQLVQKTSLPEQEVFRLGFTYLLKGNIHRAGSNFMLELQLTDSLGKLIWSTKLPTPSADLAFLPGEITKQLSEVLKLSIQTDENNLKLSISSKNSDSYLFYLRCRELLHRKTPESLKNAYELMLQAVQDDPKFAEGLALASDILVARLDIGAISGDTIIYTAKNLADAAIKINPALDKGYISLGKVLAFNKNYNRALIYFDTALTLTQYNSVAWFEKGKLLFKTGKTQEGLDAFNRAYQLDACNPEILETYAGAYQLLGKTGSGMFYHERAIRFTPDSLAYIAGPVSDAILVDPDLRLSQSQRVLTACAKKIMIDQDDYHTLYNYARLKQVMGHLDSDKHLKKLENLLQEQIRKSPKNALPLAYLALAETRLGKFPEAAVIADRAIALDPNNAEVRYKVAQIYSLQMYFQKEKKYDEKKKNLAARYLREAISLNYKFNELVNADFFNMLEKPDYKTAIQERSR